MDRPVNKIVIKRLFSEAKKDNVKYIVNTNLGKIYLYLIKESELNVSGKLIFVPNPKF